MSTRAAISSKRARETLVRLLFTDDSTRKHSYAALKQAYLDKVHELHPDKNRHVRDGAAADAFQKKGTTSHDVRQFIELKSAWEEYDKIMKLNKLSNAASPSSSDINSEEDASFTLFGVGCSFADSPTEREYRNEIMEQACRGWFSSGELATGMLESKSSDEIDKASYVESECETRETSVQIIEDEHFIDNTSEEGIKHKSSGSRKSLVQDLDKFKRR